MTTTMVPPVMSSMATITALAMLGISYNMSTSPDVLHGISNTFSYKTVLREEETETPTLLNYSVQKHPVVEARELFPDLRGFTQEESDEYEAALDAMSTPVGISFFD